MHTIKMKYKGIPFTRCISDEVFNWLFIDDYDTYLRRASIMIKYAVAKLHERLKEDLDNEQFN